MPAQRRPPPPPPDGGGAPPPLPNRGGPAATPAPVPSEGVPPPLPARTPPSGGNTGPTPPSLPARPSQTPQRPEIEDNVYLDPEELQDTYEAVDPEVIARFDPKQQQDELYEEMEAPLPNHPPPVPPFKPQVPSPPVPDLPKVPLPDLPAVPELPQKPRLPLASQATGKPPLPLNVENGPNKSKSLRPWNSFREMISRSREKGAQDDDRKRKISAPAKSGKTQEEVIDDELGSDGPQDVYEVPETSGSSHSGVCPAEDDDDGCWSDDEFDDCPDVPSGGDPNTDNDLYLQPDNGPEETMDSTYEAPDTGFDSVPSHIAPPPKPSPAQRNSPVGPAAVETRMPGFLSIQQRMKMLSEPRSNTTSTERPPGGPLRTRSNFSIQSPPVSNATSRSQTDQSSIKKPLKEAPTDQPKLGLPSNSVSASTPPVPSASKRPTPPSKPSIPSKTPTPSRAKLDPNAPPDLPPNHPRRPSHDDNGSAGSLSSGSGGSAPPAGFMKELNKVISLQPSLWNAQVHQVTRNLQNSDISNGGGEVYSDGVSAPEPAHPLSIHPWFHEDASRTDGEERVKRVGQMAFHQRKVTIPHVNIYNTIVKEGAYLVRKSSKNNSFTLVVHSGGKIFNLPISQRADGKYAIGEEKFEEKRFESVPDFIEHHLQCNITLSKGGTVKLSKAAPRPRT